MWRQIDEYVVNKIWRTPWQLDLLQKNVELKQDFASRLRSFLRKYSLHRNS